MAVTVGQLAVELRIVTDPESDIPDGQEAIITRLLATAVRTIQDRASGAPQDLKDQAVIVLASYLYDRPSAAAGAGFSNAWLNSGAESILSRYVVRRATVLDTTAPGAAGVPSGRTPELWATVGNEGLLIPADKLLLAPGGNADPLLGIPYTRRATMRVGNPNFTEADFLGPYNTTSDNELIDLSPDFPVGGGYLGFAVPASRPEITEIELLTGGDQRAGFLPSVGDPPVVISIDGLDHDVYASEHVLSQAINQFQFRLHDPAARPLPAVMEGIDQVARDAAAAALAAANTAAANAATALAAAGTDQTARDAAEAARIAATQAAAAAANALTRLRSRADQVARNVANAAAAAAAANTAVSRCQCRCRGRLLQTRVTTLEAGGRETIFDGSVVLAQDVAIVQLTRDIEVADYTKRLWF